MDRKVFWRVSLDNGETFVEGKGKFEEVDGELSPYQKLLKYLEETGAKITSMALVTDRGKVHNLPSAGNKPNFSLLDKSKKPKAFKFFRTFAMTMGDAEPETYAVIEADMSDSLVQIWVSENNPLNSWVAVL